MARPDVTPRTSRVTTDWLCVLFAVALLFAIGIPQIFSRSLSTDEGYTAAALENLSGSIRSTHLTMSGYYLLLWVWARAGTSLEWLRMFSLVAASGAIVCTRAIAMAIGGRRLACVAVIILPLLAMFQWKATEARSYSVEILVVSICWLILVSGKLAQRHGSSRWWVLLGLLGIFGETLHGLLFVQFLPMALYLVLRVRSPRAVLRACALALIPAVVAGILWMTGAQGVGIYMIGGPSTWIGAFLDGYFGHAPIIIVLLAGGTVLWLVSAARASMRGDRWARDPLVWIPGLWTLGPLAALIVLSLVVNRFNARYLSPVLPGLALLFGQLVLMPARWKTNAATASGQHSPPLRSRLTNFVPAVIVIGLIAAGAWVTPPFVVMPWREMTHLVATDPRVGNCIIFAEVNGQIPEQVRPPFEFAWSQYQVDNPPTVLSSRRQLGRVKRFDLLLPPAEVASHTSSCQSIWMVATLAYGVNPMNRYLSTRALREGFETSQSWNWPNDYRLTLLRRK